MMTSVSNPDTAFLSPQESLRKDFMACFVVKTTPATLFPLLCPTREYDWIPDWDCHLVHSDSGFAEELCIFVTEARSLGQERMVWVQTHHEPNSHIAFVRFSKNTVSRLDIRVVPISEGTQSHVTMHYSLIGLTEEGNRALASMSPNLAKEVEENMQKMLDAYLSK